MTSAQVEDGGFGPPVKGIDLVFLWVISIVLQSPGRYFASVSEGSWLFCMRWRGGVEGVFLLPLPVLSAVLFLAMPTCAGTTGALLCCYLIEYTCCCVAVGCKGQWGYSWETEEQTGSQRAGQYSAGCSLPQSGVLWQLSGREVLLCSLSIGHHQLGWRGRRWFHLSDGCG